MTNKIEKSSFDNQICCLVRKIVSDSNMKQRELAEKMGITEVSVSKMLNGVSPLPIERFFKS